MITTKINKMFKYNNNSRTQVSTQQNTFGGTPNTLNSSNLPRINNNGNGIGDITSHTQDDDIMFAIVTGNLPSVRRLVTPTNVNNIIDRKNRYTALHHAVRIKKNDQVIEYLLSIGADPKIKSGEDKDSIDLTIESNNRYPIDKMMRDKDIELDGLYTKLDDINYKFKEYERNNKTLVDENQYLKKSSEQYVSKIEELKTENTSLKRKYEKSEEAFANLLKKTKKN